MWPFTKQLKIDEIEAETSKSFSKVQQFLKAHGAKPSGPPFIKYNIIDMEKLLDVEFGFPVDEEIAASDGVSAKALPKGRYAHIGYTGHFKHLIDVNAMLLGWASCKHLGLDASKADSGDAFASRLEVYKKGPEQESDPRKWQSEVFIKLKDA